MRPQTLLLSVLLAGAAAAQTDPTGAFDRLIQEVQTAELQRALGLGPAGTAPPGGGRPPGNPGEPVVRPPVVNPPRPPFTGRLTLKGYGPAEWAMRAQGKGAVRLDGGDLYLTVGEGEAGGLEGQALAPLRGDFDAELHFRPLVWEPTGADSLVVEYRFASAGAPASPPFAIRLTRTAGRPSLLEVVLEGRLVPVEDAGRSLVLRRRGGSLALLSFAGAQGWQVLARWTAPVVDLAPTVTVRKTGRAAVQLVLMLRDGKALVLPD